MKPGRIILALVFLVLSIVFFCITVKGWRAYSYESVFPEDVNAVVRIHKPLDVPLKALNSTVATKFFATKKGKEALNAVNQALAATGEGGGGPKPTFYKEDVGGVTVFYIVPPAPPKEGEVVEAKKPAKGGKALTLGQIKKGLAVGGAVVKDVYAAVYGNPMELASGGDVKPKFMVALDLGRLASPVPGIALSGSAKPAAEMPPAAKLPKDAPLVIGLAFMRNLVIIADPEGIKRMVNVAHGTPMKSKVIKADENGNEVTAEVALNTKPLGKSDVWAKAKKAWGADLPDLRVTILVPNLITHFQSDEATKAALDENEAKFGIKKLVALDLAVSAGGSGLKIQTTLVADAGHPLFKFIDQPEIEMKWPDLLPNGYVAGAGLTAKNFQELLTSVEEMFGEQAPTSILADALTKVFGVSDVKALLKHLTSEVSVVMFATGSESHTVYCLKTAPAIKDWLAETEKTMSEQLVATAESKLAAAKAGGVESFEADTLKKAEEALGAAKNAITDKNLAEAIALARKSIELSDAAIMSLYKQAAGIMVVSFANATAQEEQAKKALDAAKTAFDSGDVSGGVENSRKALGAAKCARSFERAMQLIQSAETAQGAATTPPKPKSPLANAKSAMALAQTAWDAGDYATADAKAKSAGDIAKQILGADVAEPTFNESSVSVPDATLPEVEGYRVVQKTEVFSTAGETPMDYAFFNDNMCIGSSGDVEAYISTPKDGFFKSPNAQELFKNVPRETQGLAVVDLFARLKSDGFTEMLDPETEQFVSGLNLLAALYLTTTPTSLTLGVTAPVKLFDGNTGGGVRILAVLAIYIVKLALYLLTALFIYLTVKTIRPKKA